MQSVNMLEAKSALSRLVDAIEQGREQKIIIARNSRPAANLTPIGAARPGQRLGIVKGSFDAPDAFDKNNNPVARSFQVGVAP